MMIGKCASHVKYACVAIIYHADFFFSIALSLELLCATKFSECVEQASHCCFSCCRARILVQEGRRIPTERVLFLEDAH